MDSYMQNMMLEHCNIFLKTPSQKVKKKALSSEPLNPMLTWYTKQSGPVDQW